LASNAANESARPLRRSTRVDCSIPMTVMGVDAWRGPYTENVSTVNVSAHGCKYESAHQVLNDSLVIIEFKKEQEKTPRSARGRVKYVKRPPGPGRPFETAVELENPGNVWGLDQPPKDWAPFSAPKEIELDTAKPKPFALPRPEPEPHGNRATGQRGTESLQPSSGAGTVAQVMGGFQQQLEKVLSDAAAATVQQKTEAAFEEFRARIQEETRKIISETTRTAAANAIEGALKHLKTTAQETSNALRAQWSEAMQAELQAACDQIQARRREMDDVAESLSVSALEKLQHAMETSRRESVDRIIARLKEQSAPLLQQAQKVLTDLDEHAKNLSAALQHTIEESNVRIQQSYAQFEKQFDKVMRDRLEAGQEEFMKSTRAAAIEALRDLRGLAQKHESETKARLQSAIDAAVQQNISLLQEKAAGISEKVAGELEEYSRSHLELVGGAISDLAKGLGKKARG
jgi:hypothetical protein